LAGNVLAPSEKKQALELLMFKTTVMTPEKVALVGPFLAKLPEVEHWAIAP